MKVVILAGGKGTRLSEETIVKPKPLVEIGNKPILWHIMMHYSFYKFSDFIIALGYKGDLIKKYFIDYLSLNNNLTVDFSERKITPHDKLELNWKVELIDTGIDTLTGGRIKRLAPYIGNETFMLTWGDGVSNVNLSKLLQFHKSHGKLATMTAVRPTARYGHLEIEGDQIIDFSEKPQTKEGWINGAFFVLEAKVFDYIEGDDTQWEKEPLETLAREGQLMAFKHESFWQCMDTLREKYILNEMWKNKRAPWKIWE